ncbi:hypothetical protein [Aureispira anguillae]|uniref:Uncharacterized protein n=1 Tax=Aureispira anguillae TaxID=2864201 RepID=A0A916DRJ6_9BACT|nr:hypothetical protein [Aureispira anguillae]BDS10437.1 hypothetical protein AsAng_0011450 [Aureispira anguillae]
MEEVYIAFFLWTIIALFVRRMCTKSSPFEVLEANNILIALIAWMSVIYWGYELYVLQQEGHLYEMLAFYYRTMSLSFSTVWLLLSWLFIEFLIQAFWVKKIRKNGYFSMLVAMLLNISAFTEMYHWKDVIIERWKIIYTYSPPPSTSNQDLLPSTWTYYPSTIDLFEVAQMITVYSILVGFLYFVTNAVLRQKHRTNSL